MKCAAGLRIRIRRSGGVLFEVVLSLALFGGAAAFALGAVSSVFTSLDRSRRLHEAVDLARSKMNELEAGWIALADLRGQAAEQIGTVEIAPRMASPDRGAARWMLDVKTERTPFAGLVLVELTVSEDRSALGAGADSDVMRYTLRQLVRLGGRAAEEVESDHLMSGLPRQRGVNGQ